MRRTFFFYLLWLAALCVPAQAGEPCPKDFIDQINGNALTNLQKVNLGKTCQGESFTMEGFVRDVEPDTTLKENSPIIVKIDLDQKREQTYWFQMAPTPGCDPAKINKGDRVIIKGAFRRYLGFSNRYAEADNGTCR